MDAPSFASLCDTNLHQLFVFCSRVPLPLSFGVHTWFVINNKGDLHRWEFGKFRSSPDRKGIDIFTDLLAPTQGMNIYPRKPYPRRNALLVSMVEGELAREMSLFIEHHAIDYPFRESYKPRGPNSNTFIQRILDAHPTADISLPPTAFGKNAMH